jgi:hypothetical protein
MRSRCIGLLRLLLRNGMLKTPSNPQVLKSRLKKRPLLSICTMPIGWGGGASWQTGIW